MLNNLKRGNKIITSGGIIGSVSKVSDNRELLVEIADGVEIKIAPGMVADLYSVPEIIKGKAVDTSVNKSGLLSTIFGKKK